MLTEGK